MKINTQLSAFPLPLVRGNDGRIKSADDYNGHLVGLTKIEYGALLIAQGLIANGWGYTYPDTLAEIAVSVAASVLKKANE